VPTRSDHVLLARRRFLRAAHAAAPALILALLAPVSAHSAPAPTRRAAHISAAGQALMLEIWDAGGLRSNVFAQELAARRQSMGAAFEPAPTDQLVEAPAPGIEAGPPFLANDVNVNNLAPAVCDCAGRGLSQAETTIAAWGPYVLVSYNDNSYLCKAPAIWPSQGHGYSMDYGATFHDGGLLFGPGTDELFQGDPTVAVNKKTGAFYISGLLRKNPTYPGVVALKGHFDADSFAIDVRRDVGLSQGSDSFDKPWMAVDSLSGNVYVTWTNFRADGSVRLELQRCDADLNPLGPVQVIDALNDPVYSLQGTNPTVGPSGELYIPWGLYDVPFSGTLAAHQVVRSDDFGVTFGPIHTVSSLEWDTFSGGPGSRRGFGGMDPGMAVDMSHGPHRGRAYMVWDECVHYQNAVFGTGTAAVGRNSNFSTAVPFVPGKKIRGTFANGATHDFAFTGHAGQTFVLRRDSLEVSNFALRIMCSSNTDATTLANYHTLVFAPGISEGGAVCGLPYDGTYYVWLGPISGQVPPGAYALSTAFYTPGPGELARDQRDEAFSYSDDGASWSAPIRLNDSAPGFDGCFPAVTVDGLGRVHAFWLDWRSDPGCGDISDTYMTSSGDGGLTWGANRRLSDVSSYWSYLGACSNANQGDYEQIAADGDRIYAAFPDSRNGNPDVYVDAAVNRMTSSCPAGGPIQPGADNPVTFHLTNGGNFDTPLAWRIVDDAGWLTGATPGVSGTQGLAANGGTLTVAATLHPPLGCVGDSSRVRFITSDPFIPGRFDTCVTVVRCEVVVPALISLVGADAAPNRVTLTWYRGEGGPFDGTIQRRRTDDDWADIGQASSDGTGRVRFVDDGVAPGNRYGYRLSWLEAGAAMSSPVSWIDVPVAFSLSFSAPSPNPSAGPTRLRYVLPRRGPVRLDLFATSGARVRMLESGAREAGAHDVTWDGADDRGRRVPPGAYLAQLVTEGGTMRRMLIVVR
jgi:hypothetical protein